ncbi:MAG TPA: PH domain-containing protein, partial [Kouleothrix sp.]|nr:PH domain-containing protein [Kouleothrix sp.]
MAQTQFEAAPLDSYAEQITSGIAMLGGLLTLPALFLYLSGMLRNGIAVTGMVITMAVALAMVVWLLLNYAVQPTSYVIEAQRVLIKRRWARAMPVPFEQIMGVSLAAALADMPRFGLRRSFNAGVFGYQGPFRLEQYGAVFFVATNRERLVALARRDRTPLLISPARPRDFVEDLRDVLAKQP